MGHASLQVCMDSSDWLQGAIHEESNGIMMMDSSSSPSGEMLTCSRPPGGSSASASASSSASAAAAAAASALMQEQSRRLRPPHDTSLKCPRCDSTHTKFCYYNNYSLSQPRYFCKTCRRYWTKGGTLRNIPVGGGCRKNNTTNTTTNNNNKKNPSSASSSAAATKKTSSNDHLHPHPHPHHHQHQHHHESMISPSSSSQNPIDLHLSITDMHLNNLLHGGSFMDNNPITRPIDFLGNADQLGMIGGVGGGYGDYLSFTNNHGVSTNFDNHHHGPICPPFGISLHDGGSSPFMENNCQRLMGFSYDEENHQNAAALVLDDVKPNTKLLSLDNWQDHHHHQQQQQQQHHHLNGFGSWTGMMMNNNNANGFGSSTIS